jgi:ABC-type Na+ efflux pump permease subunit
MRSRIRRRAVIAIIRKELRELRRNGNVVYAMVVLPVIFTIQPLVSVFVTPAKAGAALHHEHELVYLLAIPALVPAALAAYSIVGERVQGTLEPLLATPIGRRELILGKALAVFVPSVAVSYLVFALFIAIVELFAEPSVASGLVQGIDVLCQVLFTPLIVGWSIWVGMAISARANDVRFAGQISILVSLPVVAVTSLIAFNVIPAELPVVLGFAVGLFVLNRVGLRATSATFDRERLITTTK